MVGPGVEMGTEAGRPVILMRVNREVNEAAAEPKAFIGAD